MNAKGKLLDRSAFCDYLSFVVQFSFADMRAMTDMGLAGRAVLAQGHFLSLIVGPSFRTALL